jgi:hypothetical protein
MKRTKRNSYAMDDCKWYLILDGKTTKVVSEASISDYEAMSVVIVEITASQATAILLLNQTYKTN